MTSKDAIEYWIESAKDARKTARALRDRRRYHHALFFCHLALEKALKGLVLKRTGQPPPFVHNLLRLAEMAELKIDDEQKCVLLEVSTFNIAARYDDFKASFRKKARGRYFSEWFKKSEKLIRWLLVQV